MLFNFRKPVLDDKGRIFKLFYWLDIVYAIIFSFVTEGATTLLPWQHKEKDSKWSRRDSSISDESSGFIPGVTTFLESIIPFIQHKSCSSTPINWPFDPLDPIVMNHWIQTMALSDRNKLLARSKNRYRIKIGKSKKLVAENKFLTREVLTTLRCEIGAACWKTLLINPAT